MSYTKRGSQSRISSSQATQGPDGVLCLCKPPKPAIRLEVKKDGPNKGRFFYKCDKPNESEKCKFFKWEQDSDVPSSSSSSNFPAGGNRLGSSTPRPPPPSTPPRNRLPPATPSRPTPASNKRRAVDSDDEEEWQQELAAAEEAATQAAQKKESQDVREEEEDDIEEPGTPESPAKRPRFDSFRAAGLSTPAKSAGGGSGGPVPPHVDPESPFHARKAALFPSGTPTASPSSAAATGPAATVDALMTAVETLGSLSPQIEALKRDIQRNDRVSVAWGKERETLRRKNVQLSDRVKFLELEVEELKARLPTDSE